MYCTFVMAPCLNCPEVAVRDGGCVCVSVYMDFWSIHSSEAAPPLLCFFCFVSVNG